MNNDFKDPYTYDNGVLKNKFNIQEQNELDKLELIYCYSAEFEYIKRNLNTSIEFSYNSILDMHFILFNKVYDFAGKLRTVNISKGTPFAPVQFLDINLRNIWQDYLNSDKTQMDLVHYYRELNFIHPFREGNGRSGRMLLQLLYIQNFNKLIDFSKINKEDYLNIMINNSINPNKDNLEKLCNLFKIAEIDVQEVSKNILSSSIHNSLQYEYNYDITPYLNYDHVEQKKDNSLEKEQNYKKTYQIKI